MLDFLDLVVNVNKALTSQGSWESLWLDEVTPEDVPHHWLRGTAHPIQIAGRISPGTPGDNQLIAYLFRVHDLVSADRALVRLVDQLAGCDPPFDLARGHRVRQGTETFREVLSLIEGSG